MEDHALEEVDPYNISQVDLEPWTEAMGAN